MGSQIQQRLFILDTDLSNPNRETRRGRIVSCLIDGSDLQTVIDNIKSLPDGITIDHATGHMYWTNMGSSLKSDSGSIERANLDGSDRQTIVPAGTVGVFTPKQITLAKISRKLYWCDREGMKVMRANLDGSDVEVLVSTGETEDDRMDQKRWCVGIAVDEQRGVFYWSQKGPSKGNQGRIFRAPIHTPQEEREKLTEVVFENLPEPIDLEMDEERGDLYWTDRGDPPSGNSLNRAAVYVGGQYDILAIRLHETIGLSLDTKAGAAYVTDLAGGVYSINVQTRKKSVLFTELGDITGIALV
ncbi:low-density lipoprotein receptor YWTD [Colletotrichum higginsianum]|uniref:Low-density lipoprotein receptor YWTD n=1 Tax=Colletotrichum higginsianum (strain IMI 349063) TaxID=759273 RepID=H1V8E7_COLHI|nr:Low-density lipoprotein receptor YWTD [Colletotrichum higginsianum IMI 349063]OBR14825.1 Low-density lipoprotein receptor YWTD [Colletotrichum higginsianum IMI 349063]CCF36500.1 low-density lipoprotein receptor YWTD [Colletotrichum higginsianum]